MGRATSNEQQTVSSHSCVRPTDLGDSRVIVVPCLGFPRHFGPQASRYLGMLVNVACFFGRFRLSWRGGVGSSVVEPRGSWPRRDSYRIALQVTLALRGKCATARSKLPGGLCVALVSHTPKLGVLPLFIELVETCPRRVQKSTTPPWDRNEKMSGVMDSECMIWLLLGKTLFSPCLKGTIPSVQETVM